jgi:hypothetical protein
MTEIYRILKDKEMVRCSSDEYGFRYKYYYRIGYFDNVDWFILTIDRVCYTTTENKWLINDEMNYLFGREIMAVKTDFMNFLKRYFNVKLLFGQLEVMTKEQLDEYFANRTQSH